ncbi:hypothetical protein L0Z72_07890 [candidate division KSB1 bacterium]|nr:hypothetical protein [candidate division KSB1 bacterium]
MSAKPRTAIALLLSYFFFSNIVWSQNISFEGSVICEEMGSSDQKRPAKYVIVIPKVRPDLSAISTDYGYYRLVLPYKSILDQSVTLFYVGKTDTIETQKLFISQDDLWDRQIRCPTKYLNQACERFENNYLEAESKLSLIQNKLYETSNLDLYSSGAGGAGSLIYVFSLLGFAAAAPPIDSTVIDTLTTGSFPISPKKIIDGIFLQRGYSEFSQNIGFNFTPLRNMNEAIFWNASSMTLSAKHQISLSSDYKQFLRAGSIVKINDDLAVGFGLFGLFQKEIRQAFMPADSIRDQFRSNELAFIGALAFKPWDHLSLGFSIKYLYQNVQTPLGIKRVKDYSGGKIIKEELSFIIQDNLIKQTDFDLSATIEPLPYFRFGMILMNVLGTKFQSNSDEQQNSRAFGCGVTFQKKRINIGSEINLIENNKGIWQVGINYIPFNHVLFNLGFSSYHDQLLLGANYRNLFYSFNHDRLRGSYHILGTRIKF